MRLAGFPFFVVVVNRIPDAIAFGWLYSPTHSILGGGLWHGLFDFANASAINQGTVAAVMSVLVMAWAWIIVIGKLRGIVSAKGMQASCLMS